MRPLCAVGVIGQLFGSAARLSERYGPAYHFTPAGNWTKAPFPNSWGHMSCGHACSTDLVYWKEQPVALAEEHGTMMFTASAVSGRGNSSHLCEGPDCLIAVYTGHKEATATESRVEHRNLSVSDDGMTWRKYERNPVLNRNVPEFRDPKVSWHEWTQLWIMMMLALLKRAALRYGSKDLKDWTLPGDFGPAGSRAGAWECPDMFELPVDGDAKNTRRVLKTGVGKGPLRGGSGGQYFLGTFDGGLGVKVAQVVAETEPCAMEFVGIENTYAESGSPEAILDKYGLLSRDVTAAVRRVLARKRK